MSTLMHLPLSLPWLSMVLVLLASPMLAASSIEKKSFGQTADGQPVEQITLTNPSGASASFITYGATVTRLVVPDKQGKMGDVVLGFDNIKQYETQSPYFGACIGRVGNRIAQGIFYIDHVRYCVPINNGPNHLHGGFKGYSKRVWLADTGVTSDGPSVRFQLTDPDGCEGYPGTVKVTVIYSLTKDNTLKIQYYATTDKATPINLCNHSYFNLKDDGKTTIAGHVLKLYADNYTPVDETLIPTGEIAPVKGTPLDFTNPKPIGQDLNSISGGTRKGYDHNLVLRNQDGSFAKAAEIYEPETGRVMEVWTTEPGVQFYTASGLDGTVKGKDGIAYPQFGAFCLETQHYPDSVNHPKFPSTLLNPGEVYRQITEYRFSTANQQPF